MLIVDDNPEAAEMYERYVVHCGYRVATAASGGEAIQKAQTLGPAVIVMDALMPGVTGLEAVRQLRLDERTRGIPVIGLTALYSGDPIYRAFVESCAVVLTKPCLPEDLVKQIEAFLPPRPESQEIAAPPVVTPTDSVEPEDGA